MMTLTPEELALFGENPAPLEVPDAEVKPAPVPAPVAAPVAVCASCGVALTSQNGSQRASGEWRHIACPKAMKIIDVVTAAPAPVADPPAILPPDAPPSDVATPAPEKKRGRPPKAKPVETAPLLATAGTTTPLNTTPATATTATVFGAEGVNLDDVSRRTLALEIFVRLAADHTNRDLKAAAGRAYAAADAFLSFKG